MNKLLEKKIEIFLTLLILYIVILIVNSTEILSLINSILSGLKSLLLAIIITWSSLPLGRYINKKFNLKMKYANIISVFIFLTVLVFLIVIILPILIYQVYQVSDIVPQIYQTALVNIQKFLLNFDNLYPFDTLSNLFTQQTEELVLNFIVLLFESLIYSFSLITSITGAIFNLIISFIVSFYLINDFTSFKNKIVSILFKDEKKVNKILRNISFNLFGYLRGLLFVCFFIGTMVTIGAMIIGLPSPFLLGFIAGTLNIIPYLGPFLGAIPFVLFGLALGTQVFVISILFICGVQIIESYLLQPRVMSKYAKIHPVTVLVGLSLFYALFGTIGMIIATPTLSVVNTILKSTNSKIKL